MPKKVLMDRVSRPLLGLLVATAAFFALWLVALRPSSSSHGGSGGALGQYQPAINAAHAAVSLAKAIAADQSGAGAASTSTTATPPAPVTPAAARTATNAASAPPTPAATASSASSAVSAKPSGRAAGAAARTAQRLRVVLAALAAHKTLALLFFNPAAADDRAVARELRTIPGHGGRVLRLAVPISELSNYGAITNQVAVSTAPTLLLIDRRHTATTIVGYASAFEIAQRVADALAVAP